MNFTKFFIFLFAAVLLALPSCSDDDDDKSLNGTTWEYYGDYGNGETYRTTLTFSKNTFVGTWVETYGGNEYDGSYEGTYTYDHPNLTLTYKEDDGTVENDKLIVSDNKMMYVGDGEDGAVYIKK
ncbi:MAG: hypothetical protein E6767_12110 [Dysgonomonas sp.]|nr:hypothetical protein [Dysgonomonas sp.]